MRGTLPHPHSISKSGQLTTNGSGVGTVTFLEPFISPSYAIALSSEDPNDTATAMWNSKTKSGFGIKTENDQGNNEGNVVVDWIAIPYSDS